MIQKLLKLLLLVCVFSISSLYAQTTTVTGTITDATDGSVLPGVTIIVKGTTTGASTDFDGKYSIDVFDENAVLQFSFIGYTPHEVSVNGQIVIDIALVPSAESLDEVVVTALGIKRERKSLGYSVQEIKSETLLEARESNIANAISGKISGVQIIKGSNGPASSSKIILRGYSSLVGDNQPLIVIDGVPMDNFTGASNNDFFNPSQDLGNGLGDLNTEDIETLSVLKGASAAALYGSRAGNGVILITTKTGKSREGLGMSYSSTIGFESLFVEPDLQNSFGQGVEGISDPLSTSSWGPQETTQDNIGNFYKGGFNQTHAISFQQQVSDNSSLYTSASYLKDDSNIPGAELTRLNLLTRSISKFGKNENWTVDAKIQYANTKANNRPINGLNIRNSYGTVAGLPRSLDITQFENHTDEFGIMNWYLETNSVNPYWAAKKNLNEDNRDRFLLNGSIKNQITDWLSAEVKLGADLYTTNSDSKLFSGSPLSETGRFSLGKNTFIEKNYSALLVASQDNIFGKLGGSFTLGGNLMSTEASGINSSSGNLVVPNLFSLNNGEDSPGVSQSFSKKKINSLYALFQINYDGYLFLDITGRNDWTSSLSKENRSFFYPSVSASFVLSEMITKQDGNLPEWFNFGKLRASYAQVGNDLDPFQLINAFSIGNNPFGNTTATTGNTLFDPTVVNELIKSLEFGIEGRFFNSRLGFDFTWYKSNATNQLVPIPLDPLSGFNNKIINAGDIQNTGIEIGLNADILRSKNNGLTWNMNINYSNNKNTIEELTGDVTQFGLGGFDNLAVLAQVGEDYGVIWGTKFQRIEDETSQDFGKIIVDGNGLPLATSDKFVLGSQQPDAQLGITNTITYKNLSLGFLIDASIGGEIFSGTNLTLQQSGSAAVTVVNGQRDDFVVDGVVDDGFGNFTANTVEVSPENYWSAVTGRSGNLGITEANVYDATHIRLRTVSLNYRLPTKLLENSPIQNAKIGLSANNVWMIKNNLNGVDPESVFSTGTNAVGFEFLSSPTTSSIFLNVTVNF